MTCAASNRWSGDRRNDQTQLNQGCFQPNGNPQIGEEKVYERGRAFMVGQLNKPGGIRQVSLFRLTVSLRHVSVLPQTYRAPCQNPEHEHDTDLLSLLPSLGLLDLGPGIPAPRTEQLAAKTIKGCSFRETLHKHHCFRKNISKEPSRVSLQELKA